MNKLLMNRKGLAALIAALLLVFGSGVMYAQSLPTQMVEMLLNAQFDTIKPESFHRVFEQWQRAEYGFVRNSFDQSELQSVAQSFTLWMIFNDPFTDEDYVVKENGNMPAPSTSSHPAPSQQTAPQSGANETSQRQSSRAGGVAPSPPQSGAKEPPKRSEVRPYSGPKSFYAPLGALEGIL